MTRHDRTRTCLDTNGSRMGATYQDRVRRGRIVLNECGVNTAREPPSDLTVGVKTDVKLAAARVPDRNRLGCPIGTYRREPDSLGLRKRRCRNHGVAA